MPRVADNLQLRVGTFEQRHTCSPVRALSIRPTRFRACPTQYACRPSCHPRSTLSPPMAQTRDSGGEGGCDG